MIREEMLIFIRNRPQFVTHIDQADMDMIQ